jgi:hypothetical protein
VRLDNWPFAEILPLAGLKKKKKVGEAERCLKISKEFWKKVLFFVNPFPSRRTGVVPFTSIL